MNETIPNKHCSTQSLTLRFIGNQSKLFVYIRRSNFKCMFKTKSRDKRAEKALNSNCKVSSLGTKWASHKTLVACCLCRLPPNRLSLFPICFTMTPKRDTDTLFHYTPPPENLPECFLFMLFKKYCTSKNKSMILVCMAHVHIQMNWNNDHIAIAHHGDWNQHLICK